MSFQVGTKNRKIYSSHIEDVLLDKLPEVLKYTTDCHGITNVALAERVDIETKSVHGWKKGHGLPQLSSYFSLTFAIPGFRRGIDDALDYDINRPMPKQKTLMEVIHQMCIIAQAATAKEERNMTDREKQLVCAALKQLAREIGEYAVYQEQCFAGRRSADGK